MADQKREYWIDNVKIIACILVVLGHFFQSMRRSGIINGGFWYRWFDTTIYYFHVQLFFICSGYLYQKYSRVSDFYSWKTNALKKLITLGVPYFVFSIITWGLKRVFSSAVNIQAGGLLKTLFITPESPYWYLYILFFVFLITFTINNNAMLVITSVASIIIAGISVCGYETGIYIIDKIFVYEIWFVFGMLLAYFVKTDYRIFVKKKIPMAGGLIGIASFIAFSIWTCDKNVNYRILPFIMGIWACCAIITVLISLSAGREQNCVSKWLAKYTFPIFLMHTLVAAPLRTVLIKLNVNNAVVHFILGLFASFAGPILAAFIMSKFKVLDALIYPGRYITFYKEKGE